MKKNFSLIHPKIKRPRRVEAVKSDIRKYVKRERAKELPKGVDFWDFDCKFGETSETAENVHLKELPGRVDQAEQEGLDTFYIEVIATEGKRTKKPKEDGEAEAQ